MSLFARKGVDISHHHVTSRSVENTYRKIQVLLVILAYLELRRICKGIEQHSLERFDFIFSPLKFEIVSTDMSLYASVNQHPSEATMPTPPPPSLHTN